MLQQNNNNNYPCLDPAVLQDNQRSSVPFPGPLDFGDMSLIKTLRAWAKSGLSAKARGGSVSHHHHHPHHLAKVCQQSHAQGSGAPLTTRPATSVPARGVAGVGGQAGLGALVTVATLKASEGGRQTQTRCLLLKAEGRNYVCAVSGANRGSAPGPAAPSAASRATLVGSWLRDAVVGSKEAPGAKNAARTGACDGEVFRVKPRPAKKWRKLSNSAATTTDTPNKQDHVDGPHKLEENQQQPQHQDHQGTKSNCVSARLNAHGRKQARGSAHRGNGRTRDRRGTARAAPKQNGLHDAAVLAKENVDIINVPCAEHGSRTVKADLKKTRSDCTPSGPESKGDVNRVVTELPSCQVSPFSEPPKQEEQNISLHINSLAEPVEGANTSPERTSDPVCSVQERDDPAEQRDDPAEQRDGDPTEDTLPSTWVSSLSPGRRCCAELGLSLDRQQHCCWKDVASPDVFPSREEQPKPGPPDEVPVEALRRLALSDTSPPHGGVCGEVGPPGEAPVEALRRLALSDTSPTHGGVCGEVGPPGEGPIEALRRLSLSDRDPPHGWCGEEQLDGRVEIGPRSNLLSSVSPPWGRDEAPQGSGNWEARSGQNPDEAHAAAEDDHGKEGQRSARALRTQGGAGGGGGGRGGDGGGGGGVREQQDFGIRSADNNPPWTAPTASNTAAAGVVPTVSANATATAANTVTPATVAHACPNPAPLGAMATGLPGPRRGQAGAEGGAEAGAETEAPGQQGPGPREPHTDATVATDCSSHGGGRGGGGGQGAEEEEEDEFGGFMQAGEAPGWEEGFSQFHQVPCRNVAVSDKGNVPSWPSDWTAIPCHQTDEAWASFSRDPDGQGRAQEAAPGQWWPHTAVEGKDKGLNAPGVFLEAFPPVPSMTFDLSGIPTLKQLLRGAVEQSRAPEDYGERSLLDGFQDLNKMFGLKHKRTESPSWKHLLASLQLDARHSTHPKALPEGHDLATGHAVVSLQAQLVNKRRLSYDLNRNLLA